VLRQPGALHDDLAMERRPGLQCAGVQRGQAVLLLDLRLQGFLEAGA
jgi:hypothetical protein